MIDEGRFGEGYTKEECYKGLYSGIIERVPMSRDKVYADKELLMKAHEEAAKRKKANLELLASYGITT